jgi:hypothetical protein
VCARAKDENLLDELWCVELNKAGLGSNIEIKIQILNKASTSINYA